MHNPIIKETKTSSNLHKINVIFAFNDSNSLIAITIEYRILKKELYFIQTLTTIFGNTFTVVTFSKSCINVHKS